MSITAAMLPPGDARAQQVGPPFDVGYTAGAEGDLPLYLLATVNGRNTGLIAEFHLDGAGRMSSPRSELAELGIEAPRGTPDPVPLDAVPGLTFLYSQSDQSIGITVPSGALRPKVISARPVRDSGEVGKLSTGMFLNYSIAGQFDDAAGRMAFDRAGIFGELTAFSSFGSLTTSGVFRHDSRGTDTFIRQSTAFARDFPSTMTTLVIGDLVSSGEAWSRPIRMGGIQLRRDFSLRTNFVTQPSLTYSGAAAVPSTLDVFIDNRRAYSTGVDAGPFRVEDIPVFSGAGDAEIVVSDPNGIERREVVSFFPSQQMLKPGLSDFSLEMGWPREGYFLTSNDYGSRPVGSFSFRRGTRLGTFSVHGEASNEFALLSFGHSSTPLNRSALTLAVGGSRWRGQTGQVFHGAFSTRLRGFDIRMSSTRASRDFVDLAYITGLDYLGRQSIEADQSLLESPRAQDVVSISSPAWRNGQSIGVTFIRSIRASSRDRLLGLYYNRQIEAWNDASLTVQASRDLERAETSVFAGLTVPLGRRTNAGVFAYRNGKDGRSSQDLYVSRPITEAVGDYGYQAQIGTAPEARDVYLYGDYRTAWGKAALRTRLSNDRRAAEATLDGSLVLTGGHLMAGNPIRDAFAVVDLGVPGVPIYLQNSPVARTGASGLALVPGLSSYSRNRISVEPDELPPGAYVNATAMDVIPPRRSGTVVDLGGHGGGGAALLVVRLPDGTPAPMGAQVNVNGGNMNQVGYDGMVWVEGLAPRNAITLTSGTVQCTGTFEYFPTGAEQTVIDPVTCRQ